MAASSAEGRGGYLDFSRLSPGEFLGMAAAVVLFAEVTMIVGITAFVLLLCNGIILGRPGDSVDIGLGIGYFAGLIASAAMMVAGYLRQAFYTSARKPPGVI
jgi:hypothetical protein